MDYDIHVWSWDALAHVAMSYDGRYYDSHDNGRTWHQGIGPDAQAGWSPQGPAYAPAVAFGDAKHGSILFQSGLVQSTADGGRTWADTMLGQIPVFYANDLVYSSPRTAWLTYGGVLYTSPDRGAHWTEVTSTLALGGPVFRSTWIDDQHGWLMGATGTFGQVATLLYATHDGGNSWKVVGLPNANWTAIDGMAFESLDVGVVTVNEVDQATHFFRTTDGGAHWTETGSTPSLNAAVSRTGTHTWWIHAPTLLRSTDDGVTWAATGTPFNGSAAHIIGGDDTTVFAIDGGIGVAVSHDAGATWVESIPYHDVAITAGFALDAARVWTVTHDGAMLATTTGGQ